MKVYENIMRMFLSAYFDLSDSWHQKRATTMNRIHVRALIEKLFSSKRARCDIRIMQVKSRLRMVKKQEDTADLHEIQLLFPCDNLQLEDQDPFTQKKILCRTKSVTSCRLQRPFPAKLRFSYSVEPTTYAAQEWLPSTSCKQHRKFLMDTAVQFTVGMQRHQRHIFLFNDLILVSKARSPSSYRLKEKVRLCEVWLADCTDDVWESAASPNSSFVIGWPTTNSVVTFDTQEARNMWYYKLKELIDRAKDKELPAVLSIRVSYRDSYCKEKTTTLKITNRHTSRDCIAAILQNLHYCDETDRFQLWSKTGKEGALYPLIGHEFPFCIKMNSLRKALQRSELDLSEIGNENKCSFILRRTRSDGNDVIVNKHKNKKSRKRAFLWPFRRSSSKLNLFKEEFSSSFPGNLFGQPLSKVCKDGPIPKPISAILDYLYQRGPETVDVFRKSATTRALKELKLELDRNPDFEVESMPVVVLACVLKEYIRSLPDCLLCSGLYSDWLHTVDIKPEWNRRDVVISLLNRLPAENFQLLRQLLYVLWHISQYSSENKMTSYNLAVCVGPSIIFPPEIDQSHLMSEDFIKKTPELVNYLIEQCPVLFRESLSKTPDERQDSGAEESDSLQGGGGGYRRDDSSSDSLERDYSETSPKLSLTNLSRDSGLTLSDSQLYIENEECTKSVPHLTVRSGTCHQVVRRRRLARGDKTPIQNRCCYSVIEPKSEECLLQKRPALHRKGRAPSPPTKPPSSPHPRRLLHGHRADRHAVWFAAHCRSPGWKRSQSTSRIDLLDSELCASPGISRSSSLVRQTPETRRKEQTTLSARARQLYEESVRLYNEQLEETHRAVLVKVDSGDNVASCPPPLPPKNHPPLQRTVSEGVAVRLRQLPPVHVSDAQLIRSRFCDDWKGEISWSVAQLRSMFGQPPPYRPPPPVTRTFSLDSKNSEEESFV